MQILALHRNRLVVAVVAPVRVVGHTHLVAVSSLFVDVLLLLQLLNLLLLGQTLGAELTDLSVIQLFCFVEIVIEDLICILLTA